MAAGPSFDRLRTNGHVWALLSILLTLLVTGFACSEDSDVEPAPAASQSSPVAPSQPLAPPSLPAGMPEPITVALASTDIAVGDNRVVFGLIRQGKGPMRDAEVNVETFLLKASGPDGPRQVVPAAFQVWPGGSGGVYIANLAFDETGEWGLGFRLKHPDGSESQAGTRVQVKETSATPALGSAAPRSQNKTSRDVDKLDELTTDTDPDPDLYAKTIAEALDEGKPLVVSFATPAYCRTATCGPQLDTLKHLKTTHSGRVNFIHVEVYDNPPEIRDQWDSRSETLANPRRVGTADRTLDVRHRRRGHRQGEVRGLRQRRRAGMRLSASALGGS